MQAKQEQQMAGMDRAKAAEAEGKFARPGRKIPFDLDRRLERAVAKQLYREEKLKGRRLVQLNCLITAVLLALATAGSLLLFRLSHDTTGPSIAMLYTMAVFLTACLTTGAGYGLAAAAFGVVIINYAFTYPFFVLNFSLTGYPIAFFTMFVLAAVSSAMITAVKHQAQVLAAHERELKELEKEKMRADLLRAVSHDLRTPLTSIIGGCSYYMESSAALREEKKTELVARIQEDSAWLLNMVENLLLVTRINNETAKVNKKPEFVEDVVSEALTRLHKRMPEARVQVSLPDNDMLEAPMDAILIEQVLINLIENAIVHSGSTEPVRCLVEDGDDRIWFRIQDEGVGLPREKLKTIFDGDAQEGVPSDGRKGMGIGLTICKAIVQAHGGSIYAINLLGRGAEFSFSLFKEEGETD